MFHDFWLPLKMGRNKMALAGHPRPCKTCLLKGKCTPKSWSDLTFKQTQMHSKIMIWSDFQAITNALQNHDTIWLYFKQLWHTLCCHHTMCFLCQKLFDIFFLAHMHLLRQLTDTVLYWLNEILKTRDSAEMIKSWWLGWVDKVLTIQLRDQVLMIQLAS